MPERAATISEQPPQLRLSRCHLVCKPRSDRVFRRNWNRLSRNAACLSTGERAGEKHVRLERNKLARKHLHAFGGTFAEPQYKRHVAPFDVTMISKRSPERCDVSRGCRCRQGRQERNERADCFLLPLRRERPRGRRAADQRDEGAPV